MLATLFNLFRHHCALPNFHTSDCHHMGDSTQLPPKTQIFQFHDCWGEGQENMSTSKLTYSPSDDDRSFSTIFRGFSRLFQVHQQMPTLYKWPNVTPTHFQSKETQVENYHWFNSPPNLHGFHHFSVGRTGRRWYFAHLDTMNNLLSQTVSSWEKRFLPFILTRKTNEAGQKTSPCQFTSIMVHKMRLTTCDPTNHQVSWTGPAAKLDGPAMATSESEARNGDTMA